MNTVCEHVQFDADAATQVIPLPERGRLVKCPCCGLHGGDDDPYDPEPMRCPYCDVEAVPR